MANININARFNWGITTYVDIYYLFTAKDPTVGVVHWLML
jgi:hypothetical protein